MKHMTVTRMPLVQILRRHENGFTTVVCDDVDECTDLSRCHANATCDNTLGGVNCTCGDEYFGDDSELDRCNLVACLNDGGEVLNGASCSCACPPGYSEDSCEVTKCS